MHLESNLTNDREKACTAIRDAMWNHLVQRMNTGKPRVEECAAELHDFIDACAADFIPENHGMAILSGFKK